jgi:hypothetical protein
MTLVGQPSAAHHSASVELMGRGKFKVARSTLMDAVAVVGYVNVFLPRKHTGRLLASTACIGTTPESVPRTIGHASVARGLTGVRSAQMASVRGELSLWVCGKYDGSKSGARESSFVPMNKKCGAGWPITWLSPQQLNVQWAGLMTLIAQGGGGRSAGSCCSGRRAGLLVALGSPARKKEKKKKKRQPRWLKLLARELVARRGTDRAWLLPQRLSVCRAGGAAAEMNPSDGEQARNFFKQKIGSARPWLARQQSTWPKTIARRFRCRC